MTTDMRYLNYNLVLDIQTILIIIIVISNYLTIFKKGNYTNVCLMKESQISLKSVNTDDKKLYFCEREVGYVLVQNFLYSGLTVLDLKPFHRSENVSYLILNKK